MTCRSRAQVEIDWTLEEYEEDQRPGGANHLLRLLQGRFNDDLMT